MKYFALSLLLTSACAHSPKPVKDGLAGGDTITMHGLPVTSAQVLEAAGQQRYVLLGELHDDPRHHVLENAVVTAIANAHRRPSLVLEMLDVDQMLVIKTAVGSETFGEAVHWEQRGWPSYSMYEPIIRTAMAAGIPITGGNLESPALIKAAKNGENAASLGFQTVVSAEQVAKIEGNVRVGHCGHANDATVKTMSAAQQLRDAYFARRLLESATSDGAVLIAGAEHVRKDRAVGFHVPAAFSIGFVEEGEEVDPDAFDVVWRTPRITREDPCKEFETRLKTLGK